MTFWTLPKRAKCFSITSFLLRFGGTFLHMMEMQSVGDMPLRLSELSLRTPRLAGGGVSSFRSGGFAVSGEQRRVNRQDTIY